MAMAMSVCLATPIQLSRTASAVSQKSKHSTALGFSRVSFGRSSAFGQQMTSGFFSFFQRENPEKKKSAMAKASAATFAGKNFYDFTVEDITGKEVPLSEYKGKVALVVNVASQCGLTASNYTELTSLFDKYKDQGFVVLAFPSNQFGGQEPGSNSQIQEFACSRYKATFPLFSKVDVNGPNTAPVYQFLKAQKGGGLLGDNIKWNFGKFLVDKEGNVVERYAPTTSPLAIEKDLQKLL